MRTACLFAILLFVQSPNPAPKTTTYIGHYSQPFPGPQTYMNPNNGTLFYVETDGRHVAAISGDGKLLWIREPYKDPKVEFYRSANPQIIYIGSSPKWYQPPKSESDRYVGISFSNSQFGVLKVSNGDFTFLGQD